MVYCANRGRGHGVKNCRTCQQTYPSGFANCPQDGTALVDAWSDGTVIRGKYRILTKLGEGGMGAVYKALHLRFTELRALKVMSPKLASDPVFLKRFEREAVLARQLQHPKAVRIDDIDVSEDGQHFIVMEYIEGRSLENLAQTEGPLPAQRGCSIVKQVASALEAAHGLGIVRTNLDSSARVYQDQIRRVGVSLLLRKESMDHTQTHAYVEFVEEETDRTEYVNRMAKAITSAQAFRSHQWLQRIPNTSAWTPAWNVFAPGKNAAGNFRGMVL